MGPVVSIMGQNTPRAEAVAGVVERAGLQHLALCVSELARDGLGVLDTLPDAAYLRFDATGGTFEASEALYQLAAPADAGALDSRKGCFAGIGMVAAGTRHLFQALGQWLETRPDIRVSHSPADVQLLQSKPETARRLARQGMPIAPQLGSPAGYDELRDILSRTGHRRVILKLAEGSSGAGCLAVACGPRGQMVARSTLWIDEQGQGWNTRRLVETRDPAEIAALADMICAEGATLEAELPRLRLDGKTCDLRLITLAGRVEFAVMRQSNGPFTNLHLLNQRSDAAALRQQMQPQDWQAMIDTAEQVAALFPRCLTLGLDMTVAPNLRDHAVIEVNAFGDFVKGVTDDKGRTPQQAGLDWIAAHLAEHQA